MTEDLEPAAYRAEGSFLTKEGDWQHLQFSNPRENRAFENKNPHRAHKLENVVELFAAEDIVQLIDQVVKEQEQGHILQDLDLDEAETAAYEKAVNDLRAILKSRVKR